MVHVEEKHSELIAFADIFGAPHGPEFFDEVLNRTLAWSGAAGAVLCKFNINMQFEQVAATSDSMQVDTGRISSIHSEQTEASLLILDAAEMAGVCKVDCGNGVLFLYFNDAYGQVIGCLIMLFADTDPNQVELSVLRNVCHRIAQEIERQDAEEMLLEASEETALYSNALKDMHELGSFRYTTQTELYEKYLHSSFAVIGITTGLIMRRGANRQVLLSIGLDNDDWLAGQAKDYDSFHQGTIPAGDNAGSEGTIVVFPFQNSEYSLVLWETPARQAPVQEFQIEVIELMLTNLAHEIIRQEAEAQIRALKIQQDGDYFLTSLLIQPLVGNHLDSANVQSEIHLKQKKEFVFKNNRYELGGDYAITQSISIRGKEYGFFVNADAMGKSMQGAGGALVLGAVVDAILKRTRRLASFADQYPERWLKVVYDEIQSTFESFDGSMLVSMVMGLVDLELGVVYYVNAEHPWIVLYRDNSASFLETDFHLRKIGFIGANDIFTVRVFRMLENDILLIGSDGRDDLAISGEDSKINYDESLFLKSVDATGGKLGGLLNELNKRGSLTDDYSMLSLSFTAKSKDNPPEIENGLCDNEEIGRLLSEYGYLAPDTTFNIVRNKDSRTEAKDALSLLEYLVRFRPELCRAIYLNSYYAKLCGRFSEAIDLGERVNLRDPFHECNLINLANLYVLVGNIDRAEQLLTRLPDAGPDYRYFSQVQDVRESIAKKRANTRP